MHTRVSEQLSEDIRRFAEDLRVPASNLVRNVLEEVFTVVDDVAENLSSSLGGDVSELFDDVLAEAEGLRERVRNQAESARGRARRRSGSGRRRGRHADRARDADVEEELRRDEAAEAGTSARTNPSKGEGGPGPQAEPDNSARTDSRPRPAELFPEILGWQPLVLNGDFECGCCSCALHAGQSAFLGLGETGLTRTALCGRCAGSR